MANTDWAFGFMPYQKLLRANYYCVQTAPVINIFHYDIVGAGGVNILTPAMGYLPCIQDAAIPDGLDNILGSVIGIFDEDFDPVAYIKATEAGNDTIAGYILVADDPNQLFVAREDFESEDAITAAEGSLNVDIQSEALCAGNTVTGVSTQMIDSNTVATTIKLNLKLYSPHPSDGDLVADNTPGLSGDQGCRYICQINEHYYNMPSVLGGLAAAST